MTTPHSARFYHWLIAAMFVVSSVFVQVTSKRGIDAPPTECDPGNLAISGGLAEFYGEKVGDAWNVYCPAHTVNDFSFQRINANRFCGVMAVAVAVVSNTTCPEASNVTTPSVTTTVAPCNASAPNITIIPNGYESLYWVYGSRCIPGTCSPHCVNGGTCYCGKTCYCKCVDGFTGADCSIVSSTIPSYDKAKAFYAFADPHWIIPKGKTNAHVMDLTGNGLHAEVHGYGGLNKNAGPYGSRPHTSFIFGLNPHYPSWITIDDPSYNLKELQMKRGVSKYTLMAYYQPRDQGNNETMLFNFAKDGATEGMTISTSLDSPYLYWHDGSGVYTSAEGSPYSSRLSNTSFSLLRYEIDATSYQFGYEQGTANLQSMPFNSLVGDNVKGFYIGSSINSADKPEPLEVYLKGYMSGLLISNDTGLGASHVSAYQAWTQTNFGSGPSTLQTTEKCPVPPAGAGMVPSLMVVDAVTGTTLDVICPPFYTHCVLGADPITGLGPVLLPDVRTWTSTCGAGGYNLVEPCCSDPAPIFCDPICVNGGTCMCTKTQCSCQCWPGFTGPDCFAPTSAMPTGLAVFWPMTMDSLIGTTGGVKANDFSNNGFPIDLEYVGFDIGPWSVNNTAIRMHYLRGQSYMQSSPTVSLSAAADWTLLFYIKLTHMPLTLPTRTTMPMLLYASANGALSYQQPGFLLDEITGQLIWAPTGTLINHVGPVFTTNATSQWVPVKIEYVAATGMMGTASWDNIPAPSTPITISLTSTTLYFGYDDIHDWLTDMSVTCIGLYNKPHSPQLAAGHGKVCQMFSKQMCAAAPYPETPATQSAKQVWSGGKITFTCFNGMTWNTTGNMTLTFGCNPSDTMIPILDWDYPSEPGYCQNDTIDCHPGCLNGGTCIAANPSYCNCTSDYTGLDCSIPRNIFPSSCNLVSVWPFTSLQMRNDSHAADIWSDRHVYVDPKTILFPDTIGPFLPWGAMGVASVSNQVNGSTRVSSKSSFIPSGSSFSVSAYIRFDTTADWNLTLYPLFSFENHGVGSSPAVYVSPYGRGEFRYKSAKTTYAFTIDCGLGNYIGLANVWQFLTFQYDSVADTATMSLNGTLFGDAVTVTPTPHMSTRDLVIGADETGLNWPGNIICMSLYDWTLSTSQIVQLQAACDEILGGPVAPAAPSGCNACYGKDLPPVSGAIPNTNSVVFPAGASVDFKSPAFTQFDGYMNSRSFTVTCTSAGTWDNSLLPQLTPIGMTTCDPPCRNGATCSCTTLTCTCNCPAGFTGRDCIIVSTMLPSNMYAFWPLTIDTINFDDATNASYAVDFSGNDFRLAIGSAVAMTGNFWSTPTNGGVRFRDNRIDSFLKSTTALTLPSPDFTIIFYMNYNPTSDNQPILTFASNKSEFWTDQTNGFMRYSSSIDDDIGVNVGGTDLSADPGSWTPVVLTYSASGLGAATFDTDPSATTTALNAVDSADTLYLGFSDRGVDPVTSDISIGCVGIYSATYSTTLLGEHAKACQIFDRVTCTGPSGAPSNGIRGMPSARANNNIYYYCFSGYYFSGTSTQRFANKCVQPSGTSDPGVHWQGGPPSCVASTVATCYPSCANGGTCVDGTPTATCSCPVGYSGVDCSINLDTFPYNCKLMNLWPMTTQQMTNTGKAFDAGVLAHHLSRASGLRYNEDVGPFLGLNQGVIDFTGSSPGDLNRKTNVFPILSKQSFTISGYMRFEYGASYTDFYPLVAFGNVWTTPSPAIFAAANGNVKLYYKWASNAYTALLTAPQLFGVQPWVFVTVRYNVSSNVADLIVNGNIAGGSVTLAKIPMFSTENLNIGSTDATLSGASQTHHGQIACVSIYSVALTNSEIVQLKSACDAILGGPATANSASTACYTCSNPPAGGIAMPVISDYSYPPSTTTTYMAPDFTRYPGANPVLKQTSATCLANLTWDPQTVPAVDSPLTPPVTCDPECRNGGQCQCSGISCQCNCVAGFAGLDCVVPKTLLPASTVAFWPMTIDSVARDATGNLYVHDASTMSANVKVGAGVSLEDGPFVGATIKSSFRFRSQIANSFLTSYSPSVSLTSSSHTVIFYVKYNSNHGGHQPIISWTSGMSLWISSASGKIRKLPDAVSVNTTVASYVIDSPDIWVPMVYSYSTSTGKAGAAYFDMAPSLINSVTAPSTAGSFYIGYSDATNPTFPADVTLACLGIYKGVTYSTTLTATHGQACQQAAKVKCSSVPSIGMSNAFPSTLYSALFINENVRYTCIGGYYWSGSTSRTKTATCSQSTSTSNLTPSTYWAPTSLSGTCTPSPVATCYPDCLNGGTCIAGSPTSRCACLAGFAGLDCSIKLSTMPMNCYLVSLWTLTSNSVNNESLAIDAMHTTSSLTLPPLATTVFAENGPMSSPTVGIAQLYGTSVGAVKTTTPFPWPPLSSFTISAYVKFAQGATYDLLYPLMAYNSPPGLTNSPGLFISPTGAARIYFISFGQPYVINVTSPAMIGLGPWAFVSFAYDQVAGTFSLSILAPPNANVYGAAISVSANKPVFITGNILFVGSTDLTVPADAANVFPGQIACLSIYRTVLTNTDLDSLLSACQAILGGPIASDAAQCNLCSSQPRSQMSAPSLHDPYIMATTSVKYTCPAFRKLVSPNYDRFTTVVCNGNEVWSPTNPVQCDAEASPWTCDPNCANGGVCLCSTVGCSCSCTALFTGIDCSVAVNLFSPTTYAFWPLTVDTLTKDPNQNNTPLAIDVSGNSRHLSVGSDAGQTDGPFNPQTAFRFRVGLANSYLSTASSVSLSTSQPFTILLYVKYNVDAAGNQPIISFSAGGTAFWIDQVSGQIRYHPDNALMPNNGATIGTMPDTWVQLAIVFSPPASFAISTDASSPTLTYTASTVQLTGTLTIGYGDHPISFVSDLSIGCVAIYVNEAFSTALANSHAQRCQHFAKVPCTSAPVPALTNAFKSTLTASSSIGESVSYTCVAGYTWSSDPSNQWLVSSCGQSAALAPTLTWNPVNLASSTCTASPTTCYPACKNGATCAPGTPVATCVCDVGFYGLDCSIDLTILPARCNLISLWPLTTASLNPTGKAIDLLRTTSAVALAPTTVAFPTNGPYSLPELGIFHATGTSLGDAVVSTPSPFSPLSSLTVSAFIRFDPTSKPNILYPLMGFSAVAGLVDSPGIFVAPNGSARLYYTSGGVSYSVAFNAGTQIGRGPWAFIAVRFERSTKHVSLSVLAPPNSPVYGTPVTISQSPFFSTTQPINIGASDLVVPSDSATIFAGQIGCLAIHKQSLLSAEIENQMLACQQLFGGLVASSVPKCNICTLQPAVALAVAVLSYPEYYPGDILTYSCPAFAKRIDDDTARSSEITCTGSEIWASTPSTCDMFTSPWTCDPDCRNGGSCVCTSTSCSCICPTGFAEADCSLPMGFLPATAMAFWPTTADTMIRDPTQNNTLLAADLSGNSYHLSTGSQSALDMGPFYTTGSAFRNKANLANSYTYRSSFTLSTSQPFTIIFYVKYTAAAIGDQPILSFSSGGSAFWLDLFKAQVRYYPDNALMPNNGASLSASPENWVQFCITFSPPNVFAVSTNGVSPTLTYTATSVMVNGQINFGFADLPVSTVSDLGISCIGVYANTVFSTALATKHAQSCQRLAKQLCDSAPQPTSLANAMSSTLSGSAFIDEKVTYSCISGYYWSGTSSRTLSLTCSQSSALAPQLSWSPAALAGSCVAETSSACYPPCLHGATCQAGTPTSKCICVAGYAGPDCSIDLSTLPMTCNLISLWPLTSKSVDHNSKAVEIINNAGGASLSMATVAFPDNGPFTASSIGIVDVASSAVGDVQVASPNSWAPLSSFTISAFVRFGPTAQFKTLYPVVAYEPLPSLTSSPALFLSPDGSGRLYFVSASQAHSVDFSAPSPIGIDPWAFISFNFDRASSSIKLIMYSGPTNIPTSGAPATVSPPPVFKTADSLMIGSSTLALPANAASVLAGQIACLSIYNDSLTAVQTDSLHAACQSIVGGPAAPAATQCNLCTSTPVVPLAMSSLNRPTYSVGQVITYTCPAFSRQIAAWDRSSNLVCLGNDVWSPASPRLCDNSTNPKQCDPMCLNGGQCICTVTNCSCSCQSNYTGIDCAVTVGFVSASANAFWPTTVATMLKDENQLVSPMAGDESGNYNHLSMGIGAALDNGPFNGQSAFRFRSSSSDSYLFMPSLTLPTSQPFTLLFYVKYNLEANGNQPIIGFGNNGSAFWIDQLSGHIRYYPDNVLMPANGPTLGTLPNMWTLVAIQFQPPNQFSISTNANPITNTYTASQVVMAGKLTIGYSDAPKPTMSDLSISCVGLYVDETLSPDLAINHGAACQRYSKQACSGASVIPNAFRSSSSAIAGNSVDFFCRGVGNYFDSENAEFLKQNCTQQLNSFMPTLSWSPTLVNETCTASTTDCFPSCKNGGTCASGVCACPSGYLGSDCSIRALILTCQKHLQSYWPLTTRHIAQTGEAQDIWLSAKTQTPLPVSLIPARDDGPYSPSGFGLLDITNTPVGTLRVASPNWPMMPENGTFLISAYVRFDLNAPADTLYPFVTFTNASGVSPALFISKSGKARMYYMSNGQQYSVDFSVSADLGVVGTATPRSFVSIEYDWEISNITISTIAYDTMLFTRGTPVVVDPPVEMVIGADMLIGSTDVANIAGVGNVFPGEIAALSIYNHTLPDYQTKQVISAIWEILGGPAMSGPAAQICTKIPYCSPPPNITNSTLEEMEIAPPILGQEIIEDWYTNNTRLLYVCDFDHSFFNYTVTDMNVTCDWGHWKKQYPSCQYSPLQRDLLRLEVLPLLSHAALRKYFNRIDDIIYQTSYRIANSSDPEKIAEAGMEGMSILAWTLDRYAEIYQAGNLTTNQILKVSKTIAMAMSNIMYAMVNGTQLKTNVDFDIGSAWNNCTNLTPENVTAYLTPSQIAQQFAFFRQMLNTLTKIVDSALYTGEEFSLEERYFSARIKKSTYSNLAGFSIDMSLAKVAFPSATSDIIAELSQANYGDTLLVVTIAFIDNVFDISKPFNIPTVSIRVYTSGFHALTLRPALNLDIIAHPIRIKAQQLTEEKVDVQCDVSKITCDLEQNADLIGSLAIFPVLLDAGNFFLMFPADAFVYDAWIAFNSTPTPANFTWHIRVEQHRVTHFNSSDPNLPTPPHFFNERTGLRVIVPAVLIRYFHDLMMLEAPADMYNETEYGGDDAGNYFLQVAIKRDTTPYGSVGSLPPELCELQRCFGYHLSVSDASNSSNANNVARRRRDAEENIAADSAYPSWDDNDLEMQPDSSESAIRFKSSYFGDIGADLLIPPNTIEFTDLFARFATLLADNVAVLVFMCVCIVLFLIGAVVAYKFDKADIMSWGFLPILSNHRRQKICYFVSVHYHTVKGYEQEPKVYIRFRGELCDMPYRLLEDGVRDNFNGKHPANFLITSHHQIGRIDQVELFVDTKRKPSARSPKPFSMHVDKIIVLEASNGRKFLYPVKKRLLGGKSQTTNLASEDDVKNFNYLVSGHTRGGFSEAHPWLSIAKRPLPSNWTRVERLACVVSALFMAMLVNAMFYGQEARSPRVGVQIGSWLRISWFTIWTSIVGAVIIIPPTAIMGFIFKKIRRRSAERHPTKTVFNIAQHLPPEDFELEDIEDDVVEPEQQDCNDFDEEQHKKRQRLVKKKKPFRLPYYCCIIAWMLVAACIGTSAFIVVMYSLAWGREKSLQWLSSMLMHIGQDILVIQMIKVLIMSLISSTMLKMPDDGVNVGKMTYSPNNRKQQIKLFSKLRNVIAGIVHHILYVIVFSLVINTTQNQYAYRQVKDVTPLVTVDGVAPIGGTVTDYTIIYSWLQNKAIPNFLQRNLLSQGGKFNKLNIYTVPNHDLVIVGPIRLRQQRVKPKRCQIDSSVVPSYVSRFSPALDTNNTRCQHEYSSGLGFGTSNERRTFNGSWQVELSDSDIATFNLSSLLQSPWSYRETSGISINGKQATYETGGYYIDLPLKISNALATVSALRDARWLDNSTTALFVEFTLFNAQTNLFVPTRVAFEALGAGAMSYSIRAFPLQLYMYVSSKAMLVLAIQGMWIFLTLTQVVKIILGVKRQGAKAFFKDGWNLFDVAHIGLGLSLVGIFAFRIKVIMDTISTMKTFKAKFVSLDLLVMWEDTMFCLYGIVFFMALLLFFRNLTFNKYWAIFLGTLAKAKHDILSFVGVFTLITIMFASTGYLSFGYMLAQYQSFWATTQTLVQNIVGVSSTFISVSDVSVMMRGYSLCYSLLVLLLAVQFFMSIVNITYAVVAANAETETQWDSNLADYISDGVAGMLKRAAKKSGNDDEDERGHDEVDNFQPIGNYNLGNFERVCHRLERFVDGVESKSNTSGHDDRSIVSYIHLLMKQQSERRRAQLRRAMQPTSEAFFSSNLRKPESAIISSRQPSAVNTSTIATLRMGYSDYFSTGSAIITSRLGGERQQVDDVETANGSLAQNQDKAEVDDSLAATVRMASASIRCVYEDDYLRRPSLNPIEINSVTFGINTAGQSDAEACHALVDTDGDSQWVVEEAT